VRATKALRGASFALADRVDRPLFVREFAGLELRVKKLTVYGQLEATTSRWDQCQILDLLLVGAYQLGRQTDGLGFVASHRAILEFHVHGGPPHEKCVAARDATLIFYQDAKPLESPHERQ